MNFARTSLVVAAFLVLSMSAFAQIKKVSTGMTESTGTQSSLTIQAEIPSIDALSCTNSNDGTQNLDFNFINNIGQSSMTLGVNCTYSTNDPYGVDLWIANENDLRGNSGGTIYLSSSLTVTDGTFSPLPLPSQYQEMNLNHGLSQSGASNATITYQLAMNLGPNVKTGNYSGGQITFILGPSQVN
jgi:archaellin